MGFSPDMPFMFGRYTYVGNDPVNLFDPFGTAPYDRFNTIEEAAIDLLRLAARQTARDPRNRERGGDIKIDRKTGKYYYDNIDTGRNNDTVNVRINPKSTVAIAHTHPPKKGGKGLQDGRNDRSNNGKISGTDEDMVEEANKAIGSEISTFVGTADGSVTRFDPDDNYQSGTQVAPKGTLDFKTKFVSSNNVKFATCKATRIEENSSC